MRREWHHRCSFSLFAHILLSLLPWWRDAAFFLFYFRAARVLASRIANARTQIDKDAPHESRAACYFPIYVISVHDSKERRADLNTTYYDSQNFELFISLFWFWDSGFYCPKCFVKTTNKQKNPICNSVKSCINSNPSVKSIPHHPRDPVIVLGGRQKEIEKNIWWRFCLLRRWRGLFLSPSVFFFSVNCATCY